MDRDSDLGRSSCSWPRHLAFIAGCLGAAVLFRDSMLALARLALHDDRYTVNLVIPLIAFGLIGLYRRNIFIEKRYCPKAAVPFALAGLILFLLTTISPGSNLSSKLPLGVFAALLIAAGCFVGCYGIRSGRRALFPLFFLVLMIPAPSAVLDHAVVVLQRGSAAVAFYLFQLIGMPVIREGIVKFSLPGVTIEVAQECSGIRSSLSLLVCSLVAGYIFLRSGWSRIALALLTIPIAIFKNAVRIFTISWLGVSVDPGFLHGNLHHYGGIPFSAFALSIVIPVLFLLMKTENTFSRVQVPTRSVRG